MIGWLFRAVKWVGPGLLEVGRRLLRRRKCKEHGKRDCTYVECVLERAGYVECVLERAGDKDNE